MSLLTKWIKGAVIVAAVGTGAYVTSNYLSSGKFGQTLAAAKEEAGGLVSRLQLEKTRADDTATQYKTTLDEIQGRNYVVVESGANQYGLSVREGGSFPIVNYKGFPVVDIPLEVKLDEIYSRHSGDEIKQANRVIQKERELDAARIAAKGTGEKGE